MFSGLNFSTLFARAVVLLTAIPVHEAAHAVVAEYMGDETARYSRRISLNPFDHLDPIGALMILFFGIGYAKPVPVNSNNFRNRRAGIVLTSLAGPASNVALAWISLVLCKLMYIIYSARGVQLAYGAYSVFWIMTTTNLSLAVFNILPIPPLDGWHAVQPFIPYQWKWKIAQHEQQIIWVVLILVFLGVLNGIISIGVNALYSLIDMLTNFVYVFARVVR